MKRHITFLIALVLLSGCITLPKPVDETYLTEKTEEENVKLEKIEQEIISIKQDKDKIEKELEIFKQRIEVTTKEISELEAAKELLLEKEKLYSMTDDNDKIVELQKKKKVNRTRLTQLKAYLKYLNAKNDEKTALFNIEKTKLAVKVAELDHEKALIARAYQDKRSDEFEEDDRIDVSEYKKFLEDQKVKLDENQKKHEKAVKESAKMKTEMEKTGYKESK